MHLGVGPQAVSEGTLAESSKYPRQGSSWTRKGCACGGCSSGSKELYHIYIYTHMYISTNIYIYVHTTHIYIYTCVCMRILI